MSDSSCCEVLVRPVKRMQRERHPEFLRGGPERIIVAMGIRPILGRRGPDERAFKSHLRRALEFAARAIDVEERNHREARELARRVATEFREPVVVDAKAVFLEFGVFDPEQNEAHRGVKHRRFHAVELHVLEARRRIPSARRRTVQPGLEKFFVERLARGERARDA